MPTVTIGHQPKIRLDLVQNPYGPTERVFDALIADDPQARGDAELAETLRARLGALAGVPARWVVLANGIDELQAMIARWRTDHGPLLVFPPTDPTQEAWIGQFGAQVERIPRRRGFAMPIEAGDSGLPRGATAMVMSPNDPSGTILTVQDAVRLSRQSALLVIDERHAAYSLRTLLPLVREFDNVVIMQTFETWAGLASLPLAWAIAPPKLATEIACRSRPSGVARLSLVAALATLDDLDGVMATVRRVMLEKGRLFRQLRKLNMISVPYPSWANFLLCRFERGSSEFFLPRLAERGIVLYRPPHRELRNHVRISAVSADATTALKQALIEIALEL